MDKQLAMQELQALIAQETTLAQSEREISDDNKARMKLLRTVIDRE